MTKDKYKIKFVKELKTFATTLTKHVSTKDGQWSVKGFIDAYKNIYTISSDTKIVSKIFEIHLFSKLLEFAEKKGYKIVLADHQNYYPDLTFVNSKNNKIKFAVDLKTTFLNPKNNEKCNGFTLGSHGKYFTDRTSSKNIQFPYNEYSGHICLGIIYSRTDGEKIDETKIHPLKELSSITSVVKDIDFFVA